jgi:hypothetical protein
MGKYYYPNPEVIVTEHRKEDWVVYCGLLENDD